MRVRASQQNQAREDEDDRNGQGEQGSTDQSPPQLPPTSELEVDDLELFGNCTKVIRLRFRNGFTKQRPHGSIEHFRHRDKHIGVGNRKTALPF